MTLVRTLPIRLPPVSGEALDSWLEAIAHRNATAFADLLTAVGLKPFEGTATTSWIVTLRPAEAAAISATTGLTAEALGTMTLAHYADRALTIDHETRTLKRTFPWGGARGSRYCPTCLKETGGRWQLSWRLGWTFACTEHHCLLADACPECGAVQRRRTHVGDLTPHPGRCAHPAVEATGRSPARCGADLTATEVEVFGPDHPAIRAQQTINAMLDTEIVMQGVYRVMPQPRNSVLADIRAVAGRALAYATTKDLNAVVPADLLAAFRVRRHEDWRAGVARTDTKPGLAAPAQAATAAVGVVAALNALDGNDIDAAGEALRWMVTTSRQRGLQVTATNVGWAKNTSAVLTGIQLAALGPLLKPSDQLRYRVGSALPSYPKTTKSASTFGAHHRIPTALWPAWSIRLSIPTCHQSQLRPALSAALLLVHSRHTLDDACRLIRSPIDGHALSRVLQLLEKHDRWHSIRAALIRMIDYLADTYTPIDYERRRRIDYAMLLPDKVWAQICRDTGTPGPRSARARIARRFLFERLSGQSASTAPWGPEDSVLRTKTADFPGHLTPELAHALHRHAQEFLASQGIDDEPVTWQPPSGVLDGLDLPETDPAAVNITELHRLMMDGGITLGAAATRLNTSLDTVRHLLEIHPRPRRGPAPGGAPLPTSYNRAYANAKAALPRGHLADLYEREGKSLKDIATAVGVSRNTVASLARDYGLPLRESGRPARTTIDRDWLYNQYVTKRRALPDIAKDAGMSTANMARWAKLHSIPMRGRGGKSHSSTLAAESLAAEAPKLIRPALAGIGGRERLERFSAAMRYRTLTDAAKSLGVNQVTLQNQINRIESDLGMQLFVRAERCRSMRLTDDGARVVATVLACQRRGW